MLSYEDTLEKAIKLKIESDWQRGDLENICEAMESGMPEDIAQGQIPDELVRVKFTAQNLGSLLYLPLDKNSYISNVGSKTKQKLIDYIHSIGYTTFDDRINFMEKCAELKLEGKDLIDNYGLTKRVLFLLYHNGVFTKEDVLKIGIDIYEFIGLNDSDKKEIKEKLGFTIDFSATNNDLQARIREKEAKLDERAKLTIEHKTLLCRLEILEEMIRSMEAENAKKQTR